MSQCLQLSLMEQRGWQRDLARHQHPGQRIRRPEQGMLLNCVSREAYLPLLCLRSEHFREAREVVLHGKDRPPVV